MNIRFQIKEPLIVVMCYNNPGIAVGNQLQIDSAFRNRARSRRLVTPAEKRRTARNGAASLPPTRSRTSSSFGEHASTAGTGDPTEPPGANNIVLPNEPNISLRINKRPPRYSASATIRIGIVRYGGSPRPHVAESQLLRAPAAVDQNIRSGDKPGVFRAQI